MIEHIMGDAKLIRDGARIANILASATTASALNRTAMIIKLKRDTNRFGPRLRRKCRNHRRINPARHRNHDSLWRFAIQLKQIIHRRVP